MSGPHKRLHCWRKRSIPYAASMIEDVRRGLKVKPLIQPILHQSLFHASHITHCGKLLRIGQKYQSFRLYVQTSKSQVVQKLKSLKENKNSKILFSESSKINKSKGSGNEESKNPKMQ